MVSVFGTTTMEITDVHISTSGYHSNVFVVCVVLILFIFLCISQAVCVDLADVGVAKLAL